jgi:threonine synthase
LAVPEAAIEAARITCGREDGLLLCPEGAATLAAYQKALADGLIEPDAEVVLYNCGSGLKYAMPDTAKTLDKDATIDWSSL